MSVCRHPLVRRVYVQPRPLTVLSDRRGAPGGGCTLPTAERYQSVRKVPVGQKGAARSERYCTAQKDNDRRKKVTVGQKDYDRRRKVTVGQKGADRSERYCTAQTDYDRHRKVTVGQEGTDRSGGYTERRLLFSASTDEDRATPLKVIPCRFVSKCQKKKTCAYRKHRQCVLPRRHKTGQLI